MRNLSGQVTADRRKQLERGDQVQRTTDTSFEEMWIGSLLARRTVASELCETILSFAHIFQMMFGWLDGMSRVFITTYAKTAELRFLHLTNTHL